MKPLNILTTILAIGAFTAYAQEPATVTDSAAEIASITAEPAVQGDTTKPPADFVDVDKEPVVIAKKEPVYPALALKAGMEGRVWVKIWVDKTGKAREVVIIKSDADVFDGPAMEAARQFRFTPAYIKDKPVDVWVSVPFRFKLAEKREADKTVTETVRGKFPEEVTKFARRVLEGGSPDTGSVSRFVAEGAQAIAGGYLKPLVQALEEQRSGKQSIEQPRRLVVFCTGGMSDNGQSGYIVARTESQGKETRPHYHTIVIQNEAGGNWKIVHWHTWHSSR
jgi:TonB family protein